MRRYAFEAVFTHLSWLVFIFVMTDGMTMSLSNWLAAFNQWDVRWYSSIAMSGHGFLPQTYAFPPLHGWILGQITFKVFDSLRALGFEVTWNDIFVRTALVANFTLFTIANTIFVFLSERRWKIDRPRLWAIAVSNPMAYFALTAYTDATFYLAALLILLLATWTSQTREHWCLPALTKAQHRKVSFGLVALLFLVPWIRLTGFAFAIWALLKRKEVVAIAASLVAYLLYNHIATGDPLFFLKIQTAFDMPNGSIISGFSMAVEIMQSFFSGLAYQGVDFLLYSINFGFLPMLVLSLSIALSVWLARRQEKLWALAVLAITLVSHNQAFWRSTIRYALPLYPMMHWMLLAEFSDAKNKTQFTTTIRIATWAAVVGASLAIQVFYCRLFRSGGWAF